MAVFALMVPESACIPVPSEATLLFSGFAVSQHLMSFWLAVVAATAGNVLGSVIAYGIGGAGLVGRIPAAGRLLARHEQMLGQHALRAVFVARLLPLARTFVSLPAGARRVPLGPFIAVTAAGCALWAVAFVLVGDAAGTTWSSVSSVIGQVTAVVALALLAVWIVRRLRRQS
ncbi:MAG TPA: DedA family protein [Solirubrobacteraceae bacterium]